MIPSSLKKAFIKKEPSETMEVSLPLLAKIMSYI